MQSLYFLYSTIQGPNGPRVCTNVTLGNTPIIIYIVAREIPIACLKCALNILICLTVAEPIICLTVAEPIICLTVAEPKHIVTIMYLVINKGMVSLEKIYW